MRKLIKVDGEEIELDGKKSFEQIYELIGNRCNCLDVVMLRDREHIMLVDDNGLLKGLLRNAKATDLYKQVCNPAAHHECLIVGNVVIVPDSDFAKEDGL